MAAQILVRLLAADDDGPESLADSTAALRAELLDLDVEDVVVPSAGQAPPGTRAADLAEIGSLLVTVAQAPEALRQMVLTVRDWLTRSPDVRSVELALGEDRLQVTGVSSETQQQLVEAWLRAHGLSTAERSD